MSEAMTSPQDWLGGGLMIIPALYSSSGRGERLLAWRGWGLRHSNQMFFPFAQAFFPLFSCLVFFFFFKELEQIVAQVFLQPVCLLSAIFSSKMTALIPSNGQESPVFWGRILPCILLSNSVLLWCCSMMQSLGAQSAHKKCVLGVAGGDRAGVGHFSKAKDKPSLLNMQFAAVQRASTKLTHHVSPTLKGHFLWK